MSELKIEQIREFVISKKDGHLNNLFGYLEKEDELQLIIDVFNECNKQANEASTIENKALEIDIVSKCACPPLVACEICGEEKNLDGDFWKNKKKHDC